MIARRPVTGRAIGGGVSARGSPGRPLPALCLHGGSMSEHFMFFTREKRRADIDSHGVVWRSCGALVRVMPVGSRMCNGTDGCHCDAAPRPYTRGRPLAKVMASGDLQAVELPVCGGRETEARQGGGDDRAPACDRPGDRRRVSARGSLRPHAPLPVSSRMLHVGTFHVLYEREERRIDIDSHRVVWRSCGALV